jgi:hypothetical protein
LNALNGLNELNKERSELGGLMLFRELNRGKCKTYLIGSEKDHVAVLVDPVREKVDRYLALRLSRAATRSGHRHPHPCGPPQRQQRP